MKVTGNREPAAAGGAAPDPAPAKPRSRFSEVLKDDKQRDAKAHIKGGEEPLAPLNAATPPSAPALPFWDVAPADAGQAVSAPSAALLVSLVQEITVEAPPGSSSSVDIQFNSRTLEGLQVRIQKTTDGVEVRFSTASDSVSRLLTANAQSLADALVQRGYVAPVVSVQRAQGPTAFSTGDSRRSGRDGGNSSRQGQSGGSQRTGRGTRLTQKW